MTAQPALFEGAPVGVAALRLEEINWRIQQCWDFHETCRQAFFQQSGLVFRNRALDGVTRKAIAEAILEYDHDLLEQDDRKAWIEASVARAAGAGLFLDRWHTGRHPQNDVTKGGRRYLESWRAWKRRPKAGSRVQDSADQFFEYRDRRRKGKAS